MNNIVLFEALAGLLPSQIDEVMIRAEVPLRSFSPSTAPVATRVNELLRWAEIAQENRMRLERALAQFETVREPEKQSEEQELSASRSPIIVAIEESDDPITDEKLLLIERHMTITLDRKQADELENLGKSLGEADSMKTILECGKKSLRLLTGAQPSLNGLLDTVNRSLREDTQYAQPIAWTGNAGLLIRIFKAILAACPHSCKDVSEIVSVGCGSHYFNPFNESDTPRSMAKRKGDLAQTGIELEKIEISASNSADGALLPRIADAVSSEVVIIKADDINDPLYKLADMIHRSDHSATRTVIGLGGCELTPQFLTTVLSILPSISLMPPGSDKDEFIEEMLENSLGELSSMAVTTVVSTIRNSILRTAFDANAVGIVKNALFWTTWSWVGRALFAKEFGEVIGACYPHLMDLRTVSKREWYSERRKGIPPKYQADVLIEPFRDHQGGFHLYLTGAGGTGKSCFLRNIYETLDQNLQSSVLPVWYKVDAPSSEWENVEERVKQETVSVLEKRFGKEYAAEVADTRKDLLYFLKDLIESLRKDHPGMKELVLFIDQLERTFESGKNPDLHRLKKISDKCISLIHNIGGGDASIRLFIASRKQYLPDFLTSFEIARKHNLHFCVLQKIENPSEQIDFVKTILKWCKKKKLVDEWLGFDDEACTELAEKVDGHPLNMMLSLIRILSQGFKEHLSEADIANMKPKPWEDLFYVDELLAGKDELDWYFFLAMAHARTEIVRFSEVWWRLRLVTPSLTTRANTLGRQGVLERLWLMGHLGRTIYARPLDKDKAGFVEFFHANLRDHLVNNVMNYGGEKRLRGRRGGMPPVWRALDRLTAAARDWKQSQQLLLREDVKLLMEQKEVFVEPITVDIKGKKVQREALYLLFMRDTQENRDELFDSARECFTFSALVHDILGRWAFQQLFGEKSDQLHCCERWLRRSDAQSRIKILQYLLELRNSEAETTLCKLVFDRSVPHRSEIWRQLADILAEPLFAARYRSAFMIAAIGYLLENNTAFLDENEESARFGEFCVAASNGNKDELLGLLKKVADDASFLRDSGLQNAVERLLSDEKRIESWLQAVASSGVDPTISSREIHGRIPPRIELRIGEGLSDKIQSSIVEEWHRGISEEFGVPLPAFAVQSGEVTGQGTSEDGDTETDILDRYPYNLSLLIEGRAVAVSDFFPDLFQVPQRHLTMADIEPPVNCRRSFNEAFGECVLWLPREDLDKVGWAGDSTPFEEAVRIWLSELLRQSIADVLTFQELMPLIDSVMNAGDPRLNLRDLRRTIASNAGILLEIIVQLVRERVPLQGELVDVMVKMQEIVRQAGEVNAMVLIQRLREFIRHKLCRVFADETNQLPVMMLESQGESRLINSLRVDRVRNSFNLEPDEALHLASAVTGHFETVLQTEGAKPVLVCEDNIRMPLFLMIRHFDPRIHVLSYTELSEDVRPRSYGVVSGMFAKGDA